MTDADVDRVIEAVRESLSRATGREGR